MIKFILVLINVKFCMLLINILAYNLVDKIIKIKSRITANSKMLKKLSKSRKKKPVVNPPISSSKRLKQANRQAKEQKQTKITIKNNLNHHHNVSTFSLLSSHCRNASQCSLYQQKEGKSSKAKKVKSKNRESSTCIGNARNNANSGAKQKDKSKNNKQGKKQKKNSSLNQGSKNKNSVAKISPMPQKSTKILKQNPSKKSKLCNQQQLYERINIGLYKSKTNSEINFSNNSSVRQNNASQLNNPSHNVSIGQNQSKNKKILTIDCSDQYILNQYFSNSRIKNQEKRRTQAAIRIQKVFRGYLTRKMLQQYIEKQEQRLQQISKRIKSSSSRQSGSFDKPQLQKQGERALNLDNLKSNSQRELNRFSKVKDQQNNSSRQNKKIKIQLQDSDSKMKSAYIQSLQNSRKQIIIPVNHEALQQQSSIYGYPHDSISQYLPLDGKDHENNFQQNKSEIFQRYASSQGPSAMESKQVKEVSQQAQKPVRDKSRQISQQLFKYTPASSHIPKSKFEQPIPTDFSQKRVDQFQSQFTGRSKQFISVHKKQRNSVSQVYYSFQHQQINMPLKKQRKNDETAYQKIQQNYQMHQMQDQKQKNSIKLLKRQQKEKWSKIIQMLTHQIVEAKSRNEDNQNFMSMMLEFSKKNKQQLEKSVSFSFEAPDNLRNDITNQKNIQGKDIKQNKQIIQDQSLIEKEANISSSIQPLNENSLLPHEKKFKQMELQLNEAKQQINNKIMKADRNMDLPLASKKYTNLSINMNLYNCHVPKSSSGKQNCSLLQKTEQLKKFYQKNIQMYPIQEMVQIRQKALQKREKQMMNQLNQKLFNSKMSHEEFIEKLSEMQQSFQTQRSQINKAKMEIFVGYRATHKLMQQSVKDAWYLGFKIPFSQSLKDFRSSNSNNLWVRDLIVDQLRSFSSHSNSQSGTGAVYTILQRPKSSKRQKSARGSIKQKTESIISESLYDSGKNQSSIYEKSSQKFQQKLTSAQKRRQDLSISLPHEDSSLTIRPSNEVSQQSLFSEEISYNEGEIQMQGLGEEGNKNVFIFDGDLSQEDDRSNDSSQQPSNKQHPLGFRKVDPLKIPHRSLPQSQQQSGSQPLLSDPAQQESLQNQILHKISINQRRRSIPPADNFPELENIRKNQMTPRHSFNMAPKSQIYKVDLNSEQSDEDQVIFSEDVDDPDVKNITQQMVTTLVWEAASQIYRCNPMRVKLCKFKNKAPQAISFPQRKQFLEQLLKQIPSFEILKPRINQKMVASRLQLLKFMRVTFEDDDDDYMQNQSNDNGFEQIGKFEHILPSDMCISALNRYLQKEIQIESQQLDQDKQSQEIQNKVNAAFKQKISHDTIKKVVQREKALSYNKVQRGDLRKQIKKVQFHCIFDSLNEILMKKRLKMIGYSGIGLNQLSTVTRRENFQVYNKPSSFDTILNDSVKQLEDLIGTQRNSSQKLLLENYQRLCQNDSQWIYYTDQALSFALEFVYMLQDEIFFEEAALISKKLKRN